ncbi:CopL family metal-binding regulatory protein [Lysobacter sp. LF1]|uniref:CopL family metal-binding regulatory protein n=1 Tax=Lysobacter stagni TaxID=3045172 RepID=A0ABT6XIB5_9GAMM|nr:CopL family metal-binding regulatory protein [Lysobacter sp. LF1]MDI9239809.1 CopL family metal-binding regulatory protein [Lysobacter sp. LF1]
MSLRALVLRLLLCLTLVLNGSGYAIAATQMALAHGMSSSMHHAAQPCHGSGQIPATGESVDVAGCTAHSATPAAPADCCESPSCSCDCLQHASAATSMAVVVAGVPMHAGIAREMHAAHVPPLLPNLFRPPIA